MKFQWKPLAMAAAMALGVKAHAQTQSLPEVLVTASPVIEGQITDPFAGLSTVVGEQQVRDLNALDLSGALKRTPGVSISRFNTVGSFGGEEGGAVYIRGMGSSRPGSEIKTYVDGVPFYMAVWNHPLLDLLPVHGFSRMVVHKGPQPQVFGNNFGAIDLVPRTAPRKDGVSGDLQVATGSFGTVVEQFGLTGRSGAWDYSLAQGYARSDGHRDDADGKLQNVMGRLGYQIDQQWRVGVLWLQSDNQVSDPGDIQTLKGKGDRFDTNGRLVALSLSHDHGPSRGELKLYANEGEGRQDPGLASKFDMSGLRWREDWAAWRGGRVVGGLDVDRFSGKVSPVGFASSTLQLTSPYVAVSHELDLGDGWSLTPSGGVRFNDHNTLKSSTAPHAGIVLRRGEQWSWRAQVSRGRNYPGLDGAVLSHLIPALGQSWQRLEAESMRHTEIGMGWTPTDKTAVDLALFSDKVSDRYVFAFPPAVSMPQFLNLGSYGMKGAEVSIQHALGSGWSLFGGWTHLNPSRADIPYAPSNAFTLGTVWQEGAWRVSADVQRQSRMVVLGRARADGSANTAQVPGFSVVNARLAYRLPALGPRGEVFLAVENLTDEDYAFRPGYPMPGRNVQLGVKLSF